MPEPGEPGEPLTPQYFADQLTLLQQGEGRLSPAITTGPPKLFHLPASLIIIAAKLTGNLINRKTGK